MIYYKTIMMSNDDENMSSILCKYYKAKIVCPMGDRCVFAHVDQASSSSSSSSSLVSKKHIMCRNMSVGCTFGETCVFAHDVEEVRANVKPCTIGNCNRVQQIGRNEYRNRSNDRTCMRIHANESVENFISRTTNHNYILKTCSHICDKLYLGSMNDAFSSHFMKQEPTAVLNVAKELGRSPFCAEYMHIPLEDSVGERLTKGILDDANEFIDDKLSKGRRVLVHCAAGKSRSPSIVIAYLMRKNKWTFDEAMEYVKKKRSIVEPNVGFVKQLRGYIYIC